MYGNVSFDVHKHLTWHKSFLSFSFRLNAYILMNQDNVVWTFVLFSSEIKMNFSVIFHIFRIFLISFFLFLFGRKCSTFCLSSLSNSVVNDAPFDRFMGEQPSIQVSNKSTKISQNLADLVITVIISFLMLIFTHVSRRLIVPFHFSADENGENFPRFSSHIYCVYPLFAWYFLITVDSSSWFVMKPYSGINEME